MNNKIWKLLKVSRSINVTSFILWFILFVELIMDKVVNLRAVSILAVLMVLIHIGLDIFRPIPDKAGE